jgi:hypothetical protein
LSRYFFPNENSLLIEAVPFFLFSSCHFYFHFFFVLLGLTLMHCLH